MTKCGEMSLTINNLGSERPSKDSGYTNSSHFKSYLSIASPRRKEGHVRFGTGSAQREGNSQGRVTLIFRCIRFLIRAHSGCESCLRDSWSEILRSPHASTISI